MGKQIVIGSEKSWGCLLSGGPTEFHLLLDFIQTPAPAHPANGLSAIGFGAESDAMAGADIAVARGTATMNLNPAGITQIPGNALDICGGIIYPLSVAHRDKLGNDLEVWNRRTYIGGAGFTHRMGDGPVTVGIGLFALPFGPGAEEENEYVALQLTLSCRW